MSKTAKSFVFRYGGAIAVVALATLVRLALDPILLDTRPLAAYLAAIMLNVWFFGSGPTLISVILSLVAATYFFMPPRYHLAINKPADQVGMLIFMVFGLVASLVSEQLHRARERGLWRQREQESAQALAESERRFRQLADAMPQLVWTTGPDGVVNYFNERWYEYTGLPRTMEVDGWASALHPDDVAPARAAWREAVKSGRPFQFESRVKDCRTDLYRWHLGRAVPARDNAGRIVQWFGTSTDIDDQKRALEKLQESERLYRAIGETIDYGVWVCDPSGKNIYASESFLRLVGLSQQQCAEFGWGEVLHPDDAERTIGAWKECVRTKGTWDIEHRFRGVDGAWHSILARGVPVEDEQGRVLCWAGINIDISRLKETEKALQTTRDELERRVQERTAELTEANLKLRESEERFQAFMEHLPAGAWILDDQGRCLFVNRLYSSMTGLDVGCIMGKTAYDLYPPEISGQHQAHDRLAAEIGSSLEVEEPYVRPDGTLGELLVVKFPIRERGNLLRIGGVALDVTERKHAEDRMRRLADQLVSAEDTERRRLATDLHDSIGQSLSMLKLSLESLAHPKKGSDPFIDLSADAGFPGAFATSLQLLDNIIKQTRTLMLELYPSMLQHLGLVPTLQWYGEQLGAQAQVSVSEIGQTQGLPLPMAGYLFRAAKELLSNALRHGRAREIIMAVHWRSDAVKIVIDDDGCGFDPAQVLAAKSQRGLGLAGIHERLSSFGGKMLVESTPGQGTRIIMEVPSPKTD